MGVAVESQSLDVRVGDLDLGDVLAGETEWQSALPELVFMLDFAFGLGCWSIKDTNVVELERGTELGERIGIVREKDGVIIDVHLQRPSVAQESGGKEIEVGEQEFWAIDFGIDEHAATIVEHIKHGKVQQAWGTSMGNQRWGEASNCQSWPIWERCQRRTGACGRLGGLGWTKPF